MARRILPRARSDDMDGRPSYWNEQPGSPKDSNGSEQDYGSDSGYYENQVQSYIPISVPNLLQALHDDVRARGKESAVDINGACEVSSTNRHARALPPSPFVSLPTSLAVELLLAFFPIPATSRRVVAVREYGGGHVPPPYKRAAEEAP